jgi:hypothetical protein
MKNFLYLLVLFLPIKLLAFPFEVSGTVVDSATKKPINNAQVFVNKSSRFALCDRTGAYLLKGIADTLVELVVYAPGYETLAYKVYAANQGVKLRFELVPSLATYRKPDSLNTSQEQLFLSRFLGLSANAYETYIVNPDVLRYTYNVTKGELSVTASDMLHIINDGLGYMVNYRLESFKYIESSGWTDVKGYYFFKPLTTRNIYITQKWEERRRSAYAGSLLRFMRGVYEGKLNEAGFEVHNVRRVMEGGNDYKAAAKSKNLVKSGALLVDGVQKKFADVADQSRVTKDFRSADNSSNVLFSAPNSLLILFRKPIASNFNAGDNEYREGDQISLLHTIPAGVMIYSSGAYFDADDLYIEGYMSEKIGEMLPVDYVP